MTEGAQITCTFTNTRKLGSIKVVKDFDVNSPSSARANLLVDDVVRAANAPDGGDTGFVSVPTGTHAVSETAGTDTNLADYNSSVTCRNAAGAIVNGPTTGTSQGSITVTEGAQITCTFTNTRKLGSIKVVKDFDVNSPSSARANLLVDDVVRAANAPDGGDTGFVSVPTGTHAVSETAGTDTNLADYNSSVTCRNAAGAIVNGPTTGTSQGSITVTEGAQITCTFTNTRKLGSIKVVKDFDVNSPSSARANLLVDDVVRAANAPDGGDTGFVSVPTGTHAVSETAGTDTNLADYNSSVTCRNAAGAIVNGPTTGTSQGSITVTEGAQITCTFTNTRKTGTIEVIKDFDDGSPKVRWWIFRSMAPPRRRTWVTRAPLVRSRWLRARTRLVNSRSTELTWPTTTRPSSASSMTTEKLLRLPRASEHPSLASP